MPKRSKISTLPAEVRKLFDRMLIDKNFAGYKDIYAQMLELGAKLGVAREDLPGKTALHNYGSALENRLAAIKASTEAAVLIMEAAPDDQDARSGAVISMVQTEIFDTIMQLQESKDAEPVERVKLLSAAAKNIATLTRASVAQKRWMIEMRGKIEAVADSVSKLAKKRGASKETIEAFRAEILGISKTT